MTLVAHGRSRRLSAGALSIRQKRNSRDLLVEVLLVVPGSSVRCLSRDARSRRYAVLRGDGPCCEAEATTLTAIYRSIGLSTSPDPSLIGSAPSGPRWTDESAPSLPA